MKLALTLLLIGTTLGTSTAAFAGGQSLAMSPRSALYPGAEPGAKLTLIDSDDDEGGWLWPKSHDDDDEDDEEEDEDEDEDDDGDCEEKGDDCEAGTNGNAAKAGTVAPPKNGLFTDGTAPIVKSN